MSDHFLLEAIWVSARYGPAYLAAGLVVSISLVIWGARCSRGGARLGALAAAVVILWVASFLSVDSGYRAWQSLADPPPQAFSDTAPIAVLLAGWIPCLFVLGVLHLRLRARHRN